LDDCWRLNVEHVPNFYEVFSTKKLDDLLSRDEMEKYSIGFPALQKHASMNVSTEEEKSKWFDEFAKYKADSNLYSASIGNITLAQKDGKPKLLYIDRNGLFKRLQATIQLQFMRLRTGKLLRQPLRTLGSTRSAS